MCVVSMIGDYFHDKWDKPPYTPYQPPQPYIPNVWPNPIATIPLKDITPEELEDFKELLRKARAYDNQNGQPDCENTEKFQRIKEILKERGIDVSFLDETIEEAATAFAKEFKGENLLFVGVADNVIVAYVKKKLTETYPKKYHKFKVELAKGGKLIPLA